MRKIKPILLKVLKELIIALLFLSVLRVLFLISNPYLANNQKITDIILAFVTGIRFDLVVVFYSFLPIAFIISLFHLNPKVKQIFVAIWVFLTGLASLIDMAYFKFSKVRSGREIFLFFDSENNIPLHNYLDGQMLLLFFGLLLMATVWWLIRRVNHKTVGKEWVIWLCLMIVLFFPMRGNISGRPLRSTDAHLNTNSQLVPLSLNSVLLLAENNNSSVTSLDLSDVEWEESHSVYYGNDTTGKVNPPNILIIILESFGKEYTGLNKGYTHSYTPFLDSLMKHSFVCERAYANGLKSIDALPAIYGSIPKFESTAITRTPFAFNKFNSIHSDLKKTGYNNYFFHGAEATTMGFEAYLKQGGEIVYRAIEDYPNITRDYDGKWGIYDEPYLSYVVDYLDTVESPFCTGVFTLSSHHPYVLPEKYKNKFKAGTLDIHPSIGYSDYALREFFKKCSNSTWFDNTIFILTADHSSENAMHAFRTPSGKYEIPLVFFSPKYLQPSRTFKTVSQTDIYPTVLDLIDYPDSVWTYGHSVFSDKSQPAIHHDNFNYTITLDSYTYGMSDRTQETLFLYNLENDPNCLINLIDKEPQRAEELRTILRSELAEYKFRMQHNTFN